MAAVFLLSYLSLALFVSFRMTRCADPEACALARFVVFFACVFLPLLFLGLVEQISGVPAISTPAALLALLIATAALSWSLRNQRPIPDPVPIPAPAAASPLARLTVWAVAALFALLGLLLLTGLPRGFEVHAYHLPLAVNIFRDGSLDLWDASYMHAYPANTSLWAGLFLDALPQRFAAAANLPFLALAALATYALCRVCGSERGLALMFSAGLTTIPVFGFSAIEVGADVAGVAMLTAAVFFAIARPAAFPSWSVLAGICAGLAFGFKSLHLVPIAILGLILLIDGLWGREYGGEDKPSLAARLRPAIVFGICALSVAGAWLLRNSLATGNPLYPVHLAGIFDVLGWPPAADFNLDIRRETQFEWVDASWQWLIYPWVEGHFLDQNFKHSSGFGAFFAAVVPVGIVIGPMLILRRFRNSGREAQSISVLLRVSALALAIILVWWLLGDRQPRYVMGAIPLLLPLCALVAGKVRPPLRRVYEGLIAVSILLMGFVLLTRLSVEAGGRLVQGLNPPRHDALEYAPAVDSLPPGSVIVNLTGRINNYALYGAGLANKVVSTPVVDTIWKTTQGQWSLSTETLRDLGASHVYAFSEAEILTDACVSLRVIDEIGENPFNGVPLPRPRTLYEVAFCEP